MAYFPLTNHQQEWQERAREIAIIELAPRAEETDRLGRFPTESLDALKNEGLWGLRVQKEYGGLGEDMLTTCLIIEELSKKCPSTAMCYKMHLEGAEIISRIPTEYQVERFVKPLARGKCSLPTLEASHLARETTGRPSGPFPRSPRFQEETSWTVSARPS